MLPDSLEGGQFQRRQLRSQGLPTLAIDGLGHEGAERIAGTDEGAAAGVIGLMQQREFRAPYRHAQYGGYRAEHAVFGLPVCRQRRRLDHARDGNTSVDTWYKRRMQSPVPAWASELEVAF